MRHDNHQDPAGCAAAALRELGRERLTDEEREATLAHGLAAVEALRRRFEPGTLAVPVLQDLPPAPWRWCYANAYSSAVDDPDSEAPGHQGTHLVAADGTQLVRTEGGYGLVEFFDPRRQVWAWSHVDQPVASLLGAAPVLLVARDAAIALARQFWELLPAQQQERFPVAGWTAGRS
jgi:hypothetical protein